MMQFIAFGSSAPTAESIQHKDNCCMQHSSLIRKSSAFQDSQLSCLKRLFSSELIHLLFLIEFFKSYFLLFKKKKKYLFDGFKALSTDNFVLFRKTLEQLCGLQFLNLTWNTETQNELFLWCCYHNFWETNANYFFFLC